MLITKWDIGKRVVTNYGDSVLITDFDEDKFHPVEIDHCFWFDVDGFGDYEWWLVKFDDKPENLDQLLFEDMMRIFKF